MVPSGGLIKNSGASWRKYFDLFLQFKKKIVKSTVHLIEQVQCICLDLCIYNILRNTEETSSKHHMTRNILQKNTENERKMGYPGREIEKMATNRQEWRTMVDGPCSQSKQVQGYVMGFGHRVVQFWSLT